VVGALVVAPAAHAAATPSTTTATTTTTATFTAPPPVPIKARLTNDQATALFLADPKVAAWLKRYPPHPTTQSTWKAGVWTVNVWSGQAGEIATGTLDDATGVVTQAYTGPQVAWGMARGVPGAFGGTKINSYPVWLGFCAVFLLGLVDWRRLFSLRNLDLVMLLSFSVSLWYFNRGHVFAAMTCAYPGLFYVAGRNVWIGVRDRPPRGRTVWPVWLMIGATVFLIGFRIGLNVRDSNVIDVGLSGVVGAYTIWSGESPYGNFPVEDGRPACGPADSSGEIRNHIQTNGRCEAADPQGDTYGPVAYEAYLPGFWAFGWSGVWDSLPAAHATSILWDVLAIVGLGLVGYRFGGARLGATLAFAWAAWPFTQYASNSNTNDMIQPALLIWGFYFLTSPFLRGVFGALGAWTKLAPLLLIPLWAGYPEARSDRSRGRYALGFVVATVLAFFVLFLEPNPLHAAHEFVTRTFSYQVNRASPFSLWDWRQYHAKGLPNLHAVQIALEVLLVAGALALGRWPKRRSPVQMAAFTAAVLVGFELVLTHWSYLYLPWFFPFVAFAFLAPRAVEEPQPIPEPQPVPQALAPA
jgi:hypothetical protein